MKRQSIINELFLLTESINSFEDCKDYERALEKVCIKEEAFIKKYSINIQNMKPYMDGIEFCRAIYDSKDVLKVVEYLKRVFDECLEQCYKNGDPEGFFRIHISEKELHAYFRGVCGDEWKYYYQKSAAYEFVFIHNDIRPLASQKQIHGLYLTLILRLSDYIKEHSNVKTNTVKYRHTVDMRDEPCGAAIEFDLDYSGLSNWK